MTGQPTLLFCVGATKAGTSWLFRHLAGHPDCHLRAIKELHYFDTVESGAWDQQIKLHRDKKRRLDGAKHKASRRDLADWIGVLKGRGADVAAYLTYLTGGATGHRLVADITPAYASLPEARLAQMARLLPDVRFLYLMRDPVARFWSHVRMIAFRAERDAAAVPGVARRIMAEVLDGRASAVTERCDYAGAVTRLSRAVPADRLRVAVQEEVMTPSGLRDLWAFLGIGQGRMRLETRTHEGVPVPLTDGERSVLRRWLQPQYDFVENMFGALPQSWQRPVAGVAG